MLTSVRESVSKEELNISIESTGDSVDRKYAQAHKDLKEQ